MKSLNSKWGRKNQLELYMTRGGVPHYLKELNPSQSAAQSIDALCFQPDGALHYEFANIYHALFDHVERHITIIEALASKPQGLTRQSIAEATKLPSGGTLTKYLTDLEESGFIQPMPEWGKARKAVVYRLIDEFSYFYLKWMKGKSTQKAGHWLTVRNFPKWRAWSGYAFEGLCHRHVNKLEEALGISGVHTKIAS